MELMNSLYVFSGLDTFFVSAPDEDTAWLTIASHHNQSVSKFARLQFPVMRRLQEYENILVFGRLCTVLEYMRGFPPTMVDESITFAGSSKV